MNIRKILFQSKELASLETIEEEDKPLAADEVAGRTLASVISPGTELTSYRADRTAPGGSGYASVFEVQAVGSAVKQFKPGDQAFCMGNHKSHQRVAEVDAVRVPDGLAAERAVFTRLMGVSMSTLITTTARPHSRVLVTGLGIVGHLAAQIFQCAGYQVLACDPVDSRRHLAVKNNVTNVLPAVPVEDPSVAGKIALCVECSGHEQAVLDACKVAQLRGEVVLVGVPWFRKTDLFAHDILHAVFHRYVVLRSGWEWEVSRQPANFRNGSIQENLSGGMRWIAEGRIKLEGIYVKHHPRDAQVAYQKLLKMQDGLLTVVFDWTA